MTAASSLASWVPQLAHIAAIVPESPDTRTFVLALDAPAPALDAATPGQFVMLSRFGVGEAAFTLSDLPGLGAAPGTVTVTVRRIGSLTGTLFGLDVGARVGVRGPFGRGFPTGMDDDPTVYVAGGCGLAPLRTAIDRQLDLRRNATAVTIVYGVRVPADAIYAAHLARWAAAPSVRVLACAEEGDAGWTGRVGTVLDALDDVLREAPVGRAVLCGPSLMLARAATRLTAAGLGLDRVHVALERQMRCGLGHCGHCYLGPHYVCTDGPVFSLAELHDVPDAFGVASGAGAAAC